jgi:cytochrome c oxidase assembly protein subunit 15
MSLGAFKRIFWWEWTHRFLGRLVGFAFLVPFLALLAFGRIPRTLLPRLVGIFALGGLQGFIGWYMVSSGLVDRISVSQYRLAVHLGLAILILGALLWVALSLDERRGQAGRRCSAKRRGGSDHRAAVRADPARRAGGRHEGRHGLQHLAADGRAVIPNGLGIMQPWYLNLFENAMTVQFNHRAVAYVAVLAVAWHTRRVLRASGDARVRGTAIALAVGTLLQAMLGIWTLLAQVPLSLGLAHQAGAAALFAVAIWHLYAVRTLKTRRDGERGKRVA